MPFLTVCCFEANSYFVNVLLLSSVADGCYIIRKNYAIVSPLLSFIEMHLVSIVGYAQCKYILPVAYEACAGI